MARPAPHCGRAMLFLLAAGLAIGASKETAMSGSVGAPERPAIDRAAPARVETATFSLG